VLVVVVVVVVGGDGVSLLILSTNHVVCSLRVSSSNDDSSSGDEVRESLMGDKLKILSAGKTGMMHSGHEIRAGFTTYVEGGFG